jgi:predicted kinase
MPEATAMSTPPRIHLICGPVGAGKSTYANQLATTLRGVVFSIDEWMAALFQADISPDTSVQTMNPAWFSERVDRCEAMIYHTSAKLLRAGGVAILDLGFLRRARRDKARDFATAQALAAKLHYVVAEVDVRRQRVVARNEMRAPGTFSVSPEMFAFAEHIFEALTDDELLYATSVHT